MRWKLAFHSFMSALPFHGQFVNRVQFVTVDPSGACSPTRITVNTITGAIRSCVNGTWAAVGGGGGVTSVGLLGTASQVTVTGASPITTTGTFTLSLPSGLLFPGSITGATSSTNDFSGASHFVIPVGAGLALTANG